MVRLSCVYLDVDVGVDSDKVLEERVYSFCHLVWTRGWGEGRVSRFGCLWWIGNLHGSLRR